MSVLASPVKRLPARDLESSAHRSLATSLFGEDRWNAHVRYCRWLYQHNTAAASDEPLPIYVYWDGDTPAGQLGVIPVRVVFNGEPQFAGWCVDFYIRPSHQRRGIGGKLLEAADREFPLLMTLGQTDASYGLFVKRGWHCAGRMTVYKRFLRPTSGLAKKALDRIGLAGAAAGLFGFPTRRELRGIRRVRVDRIRSASEIGDAVLASHTGQSTSVGICRSRAFIDWRYVRSPFFEYTLGRVTLSPGAEACAVWRLVDDGLFTRGLLVDLIGVRVLQAPGRAALIAAIMQSMRADGAEVFECQTSDPELLAALPDGVFSTRAAGVRFLYGSSTRGRIPTTSAADWRLFAGDCDVDAMSARGDAP